MCVRLKTALLFSAAAHVAVLGWAVSADRPVLPGGEPAGETMVIQIGARAGHEASAAGRVEDAAPAPYARRTLRTGDFARMAYVREMAARTTAYRRSAPKGFEGILRSAVPPDALREGGRATVLIGIHPSGAPASVSIRSESAALRSALRAVSWERTPLPARYRIPCSAVRVNVSVAGERLVVGVEVL